MSRSPLLPLLVASLLAASGALASSCGGEGGTTSATGPVGPGASGTGGGGEGGSSTSSGEGGLSEDAARALFEATVEEGLMNECGACHQLQGAADAPFLAAPDIYNAVTAYPGVVVRTASQSILLTRPADPGHGSGQAPDMSADLRELVLPWLEVEAQLIPDPTEGALTVTPFKPKVLGALNTIYLGDIDETLENVSITFNATELGAPPTMLLLENLEVHTVSDMTLRLVHPLFTAYPEDGSGPFPDPADSFSGVDDNFELTNNRKLGTGTLILTSWEKDAFLGIAFELAEIVGGYIPPTDCLSPTVFADDVAPALQVCATNCHGGNNPQAQGAMDLEDLDADPSLACRQVRARIKPGNPGASQIFIVTDPLDPTAHLFKFQGSISQHDNFKDVVTPWILAED